MKVKSLLLSEEAKKAGRHFLSGLLGILFTSRLDGPKLEVCLTLRNRHG